MHLMQRLLKLALINTAFFNFWGQFDLLWKEGWWKQLILSLWLLNWLCNLHCDVCVQVIAEEKNTNPRLSSTATVIVSIADANDNVPLFQQQQYTASVSEMASPGTLVTTITATDRDSGQFGENGIVYQLSGTDADKLVSLINLHFINIFGHGFTYVIKLQCLCRKLHCNIRIYFCSLWWLFMFNVLRFWAQTHIILMNFRS